MQLTFTTFERSDVSERWHATGSYVQTGEYAKAGWERVLEARPLFKGLGCWQRLSGNVFTCITCDKLYKSVYVYA